MTRQDDRVREEMARRLRETEEELAAIRSRAEAFCSAVEAEARPTRVRLIAAYEIRRVVSGLDPWGDDEVEEVVR